MTRTKNRPPRLTFKRASERNAPGLDLDVKANALRDLMTEQCRVGKRDTGWATFYLGTAPEMVAAGIPATLFPRDDKRHKLRINAREAFIQKKGERFELVLTWDDYGPHYHGAVHPALSELARMISISIGYWTDTGDYQSDEIPTKKLLEYTGPSDYRIPAQKRFRFGPGVQDRIRSYARKLCMT